VCCFEEKIEEDAWHAVSDCCACGGFDALLCQHNDVVDAMLDTPQVSHVQHPQQFRASIHNRVCAPKATHTCGGAPIHHCNTEAQRQRTARVKAKLERVDVSDSGAD
jgi:hypothetical protein